jgi:hypothetical protein
LDGIVISYFESASDNIPKYYSFSDWPSLATWLTQPHQVRAWKDGPCWSGTHYDQAKVDAALAAGGKNVRSDENVTGVYLAVLDYDHATEETIARVEERLQSFAYAIYTTYRHQLEGYGNAFRIVLPVTRPIHPHEHQAFYLRLIDAMGGEADRKVRNCSRVFYLPACPSEREKHAFSSWQDGARIDVSAVLGRPDVAPERRAGFGGLVTQELFEAWGQSLRRKADPQSKAIGYAIKNVLAGEAFAPDGDRDNACFSIACSVAEAFPDADPSSLAEFFGQSLALMRGPSGEGPDVAIMSEKIARKQREVRLTRSAPTDDRTRRILSLYRTGRDYGYTAEELAGWGDLSHRWILTRGNDLWYFVHGEYVHVPNGPYTPTAALDYLAPATGIQLVKPKKDGWELVPIRDLCMQYGTSLDEVKASLLIQRTTYDHNTRSLVEATAPRAFTGQAEHNPWIEAWLKALLGEPGLDWLAVFLKLTEAAPALFLSGAPGVGKNLLANGLARFWKAARPSSIEDVLGTAFNDSLARCPLVFADENIPKDHGRPKIEELKRLITGTRHRLARKFRDVLDLEGAARVIIAANDPSVVFGRAALTQEDIQALIDRFVYVSPHPDARRILNEVSKDTLRAWVEGNGIAKHALWLAENRQVDGTGRLACPADLGAMKDKLVIGTGLRWEILDWIVSYLSNPSLITPEFLRLRALAKPVHITGRDTVWIRGESIFAYWDKFGDSKRTPEKRRIIEEIGHMCPTRASFGNSMYRALDLEILMTWCKTADRDLPDLERTRAWLEKIFA